MKIYFHMASRYPTDKAYGVTTGESARALRKLGHQVLIVSSSAKPGKQIIDQYANEVLNVKASLFDSLRAIFDGMKVIGPIFFRLTSILNSYNLKLLFRESPPDVVWTRDALSTLVLLGNCQSTHVVLEIHHPPSATSRIAIKWLSRGHKVSLLTIQDSYQTTLRGLFPKCEVFYGPMGVSDTFLNVGKTKLEGALMQKQEKPLRFCYLGRSHSSGMDNGLEQLLNQWHTILPSEATLTILGLSEVEALSIFKQKSQENIIFSGVLSHLEVPEFLKRFDCGIVPYPPSAYNSARFPIKLVEYCAAALNVVLTNTDSHLGILSSEIGYFYEVNNSDSLSRVIAEIRADPVRARLKAEKGYKWAQGYTYEDRVKPVINFVEGL